MWKTRSHETVFLHDIWQKSCMFDLSSYLQYLCNSHARAHDEWHEEPGDCGQSKGLHHVVMKPKELKMSRFYQMLQAQLMLLATVGQMLRTLPHLQRLMLQARPFLKLRTVMAMKVWILVFVGSCLASTRLCRPWLQL